MKKSSPKIALALGSGAARGMAHIGVLKVLEEEGIKVAAIAGTSMGAFIGALYAAGVSCRQMEQTARNLDWKRMARLMDPIFPASGIMDGQKVSAFMEELLPVRDFADLHLPLAVTATDIDSGEPVVIQHGNLVEALRAAIAFPGIFTPVRFNERFLVDGGLCNPVPVDEARRLGGDRVIGVCAIPSIQRRSREASLPASESSEEKEEGIRRLLDAQSIERLFRDLLQRDSQRHEDSEKITGRHHNERRPPGIFKIFAQSIAIMENQINDLRLGQNHYDLLIRPDFGDITLLEFHRAGEAIAAGEKAARKLIKEIRALR